MIWRPGTYEVIWRFQFFDVRETEGEDHAIETRRGQSSFSSLLYSPEQWQDAISEGHRHESDEIFDANIFPLENDPNNDGDYPNPLRFPVWPDHKSPAYPDRPLLHLSAGYGRLPYAIADYNITYGPGQASVADQVLLELSEPHLRLDHVVTSMQYYRNTQSGWIDIKSDGLFEVVQGRAPAFVVSNLDTGGWQGGFRFGGVELRALQASQTPQGYKCGACKNKPSSTSRFSCKKTSITASCDTVKAKPAIS